MKHRTTVISGLGLVTMMSCYSAMSDELFSGYTLLREDSKTMQDDDFMNPGLETVAKGAAMFARKGKNGQTCESCHGERGKKLDPKSIAKYPVLDAKTQKPLTLQQRVIDEWTTRMGNTPLKYEGDDALALEAFVRNLARGEKVNVQIDGPMARFYEEGKKLYETRAGQLDMACDSCHATYPKVKLRAQVLSQGQSNGFPLYRLASGKVVGTQSRITQCYDSFRAEGYLYGGEEYTLMELYMNARGNGLKIETPAVRF